MCKNICIFKGLIMLICEWVSEPLLLVWSRDDNLSVNACSYNFLAFRMDTGDSVWGGEDAASASCVSTPTAGDAVTSASPTPGARATSSTSSWAQSRHRSQRAKFLSPLLPPSAMAVEKTLRASSRLPISHSRWPYSRHSTSDERLSDSLRSCFAIRLLLLPWERRRFLLPLHRQRRTYVWCMCKQRQLTNCRCQTFFFKWFVPRFWLSPWVFHSASSWVIY